MNKFDANNHKMKSKGIRSKCKKWYFLMGKWSATEQERHETECVNNGKCLIGN
jgi:hypothetical protein